MKRNILALLLSLLMLTLAFLSCSDTTSADTDASLTPSPDETVEAEPEETLLDDGLGNPQFEGYEFRILSYYSGEVEGAKRVMQEDYTGQPVEDSLRDSTLYIEDRFDVKILSTPVENAEAVQMTVQNSVNAGDDAFDIQISHDGITFNTAKAGMFYNMYNIEQFDFTKPWWPAGAVESLTLADQLFCASNYIAYTGLHWTRACIVNKDYAERLNVDIPYDQVREGSWTIDSMLAYVEGTSFDLDGNGKINSGDEVGFCTGTQTWYCLQESMDIPVYRRDENGVVYIDFNIEKVDTYVTKMRTLINSSDYVMGAAGFGEDVFQTGTVLLCYGQIGDAYDFYRATDMTSGFLPTPKFDELQEDYINCCTDQPWAIPKTITPEQADIIGTICEAMSCYNYQYVLPAYFDVAMKSRTADSPDDAEMLQLIADTRTISFAYSYGMEFNNILGNLGTANQEVASYYAGKEKAAAKALEKLVASFEEMAMQ